MRIRSVCFASALAVLASLACLAQNGQVQGCVTDSQEAAVFGAKVRLINQATGVERKTRTNSDGLYSVFFVPPGVYQVFVQADGFSTAASPSLTMDVGQVLVYNVQMKVGAVSETVEVSGAPPLRQTEDASVGQVISTAAINETPLNGRNWVYISQLTVGAVPPEGTRGSGKGDFNANGQRAEQNSFILDGVDNNTSVVDFLNGASFVVRPPPDALAEFKIQTSNYDAEFGHSAGAVVNASLRSGTNQVHGNLWEYLRNTVLDARDWESTSVPTYHESQFGAMLGLPLIRNKLFFFGDTEANRIVFQETNLLTVPTMLMRQGNFTELLNGSFNGTGVPLKLSEPENPNAAMGSACGNPLNVMCASEIDSVAQKLLNLYPPPNVNSAGVFTNNYLAKRNSTDNTFQFDMRMDWSPGARDQVFARFSLINEPGTRAAPLGPVLDGGNFLAFGDDGRLVDLGQNFAMAETHVFSNTLTNEFRFGYNWGHFAFHQENIDTPGLAQSLGLAGIPGGTNNGGLPTINIGGISGFGSPEFYVSSEYQNVFQLVDNVSKIVGKHLLKFGVNFEHIRFATEQPPVARGEYDYFSTAAMCPDSITYTGFGVSDYLADQMGCAALSNIAGTDDARWDRSVYGQDSWKLTPRLTINAGLRYDYPQTYRELYGRQAEWYPTGPLVAGETSSVYVIPTQSQNIALGSAFPTLLAQDHVSLQYSDNPYLVNQNKVNFAPRVGVAYRLMNQATLRAGFGRFYGGLESVGYDSNMGGNLPFLFQSAYVANAPNGCVPSNCPTNGITLEKGFSSQIAAGLINSIQSLTLRGMDPTVETPYAENYNFAVEYGITSSMVVTLAYVGSRGRHLIVLTNPNAPLALQTNGANPSLQQPLRDFGSAVWGSYSGISNYNSLQAKLERRFANGLNFLATYTWSHSLDDAPTPLGSNGDNGYPNTNVQSIRYQYSNSPFDTRQRFTFNGNYELPFGHSRRFANRTGLVDYLIGGWSSSLTFAAQTGNPFSVTPDFSTFLPASGATVVYALLIGDPFQAGGIPPSSNPGITCPTSVRNRTNWYNPCAFGNPLPGTNIAAGQTVSGTAALPYLGGRRNDVYGPGYERINMSLFKKFRVHEGEMLQFRADIFNLFNTPSYANPNSNAFGGAVQSGVNNNSAAGGQITLPRFFQNFTPDARFFQFALKLTF
jgi:hypothetical protein